ncbi:LETM1 domain-containing protein ylh47 [Malassezia vespertilionis]|nr:LETM1 domain-containing protein ylh47 [Malassezia vespertilionis]WFD05992.1 LETM1 domain-containing protein ylh47 [Malassezia vespertilionis]
MRVNVQRAMPMRVHSFSSTVRALEKTPSAPKKDAKAEELTKKEDVTEKKSLMTKIKEEAAHYWHGTKLLGKEVSISFRLLRRMLLGYTLTRREHRQLKRTMGDLLRLIPFIPFVMIPMAELLLPAAVKLFPNMLPSTFESKFAVEEKRRNLLKIRIEMAKFLQESIKEGGIVVSDDIKDSDAFKEFYRKVRTKGEVPTKEDVIRVAKLFDDEMTLDNLTRPQLVSMCRYIQVNAFGTDNYMRFQIRHAMGRIRRDDLVISSEGSQHMSYQELLSACQSRGIGTMNMSEEEARECLKVWIKLHVKEKISGTLLILSRAFYFSSHPNMPKTSYQDQQIDALEHTLMSLPESLLNEAELHFSKEAATNKQRLEVLREQEELIEDEAEQEQKHEAAQDEDRKRKELEKLKRETEAASFAVPNAAAPHDGAAKQNELDDGRMTQRQLSELGEALSILSAKSSVLRERKELSELMKSLPKEDSEAAQKASEQSASASKTRALNKRIRAMLQRIDEQLEDYDKDVGSRMHLIETSSTGKISVADLEQALRLIKDRPDEDSMQKIVDKLDVDHDGLVPLDDVLELARDSQNLQSPTDPGEEVRELHKEGKRILEKKPLKSDIVKNE